MRTIYPNKSLGLYSSRVLKGREMTTEEHAKYLEAMKSLESEVKADGVVRRQEFAAIEAKFAKDMARIVAMSKKKRN